MNFVTLCRILTVEYQLNIGVAGKILGEFGYKENKGGGWEGCIVNMWGRGVVGGIS